jgi:hypothetical protein
LSRLTVLGVSCTLTMSSCLAALIDSMPGSAAAIFRNSACGRGRGRGRMSREWRGWGCEGWQAALGCSRGRRRAVLQRGRAARGPAHARLPQHAQCRSQPRPRARAAADTAATAATAGPGRAHLDVEARLGAGLDEVDVALARLGVALLDGHLPAGRGEGGGGGGDEACVRRVSGGSGVCQLRCAAARRCCRPAGRLRLQRSAGLRRLHRIPAGLQACSAPAPLTSCPPGPSCCPPGR